jgi:hypothetical protein
MGVCASSLTDAGQTLPEVRALCWRSTWMETAVTSQLSGILHAADFHAPSQDPAHALDCGAYLPPPPIAAAMRACLVEGETSPH